MNTLYTSPKYYEIAFGFRDYAFEVDKLEQAIESFARIPVTKVLELGCGTAPHMIDLLQRGYQYSGLDQSKEMLSYTKNKAQRAGYSVDLICGDLANFSLNHQVDLVYIMLGSLYVQNTEQLLTHLDSVARILPSGGLYLLDWCIDFQPLSNTKETWVAREGNTAIQVTYSTYLENAAQQTFREDIVLNITEGSQRFRLTNSTTRRAIYPQEFLLLLALNGQFEFVGWFDDWDYSRPVDACRKVDRSTTIIRRKDQ